jgi:dihydropteroate synthase
MTIAHRPHFDWRLCTRTLALGPRTLIMGILNATPDSFSDGGRFLDPRAALTHALQLLDEGADILDLGGESTRPNATPVTPAEEQARVLPILRAVLAASGPTRYSPSIPTTQRPHATRHRSGAEIVNDVSGLLWDDAMAATCASLNCGVVLMHTRGQPQAVAHSACYSRMMKSLPLVLRELRSPQRMQRSPQASVRDAIVLDPGFGFGKILRRELSRCLLAWKRHARPRLPAASWPLAQEASCAAPRSRKISRKQNRCAHCRTRPPQPIPPQSSPEPTFSASTTSAPPAMPPPSPIASSPL